MHTPPVVTSLHGFNTHGKWQLKFGDTFSSRGIKVYTFNYGYKFFSCLIPGFKKGLVKRFYEEYSLLTKNRDYNIDLKNLNLRPSIVVHSLGSYILCASMLKYPDILFDKIIICGSIVNKNYDWDLIFNRNQAFYVRNEYSPKDKVVRWGWVLSRNFGSESGWKGFNFNSHLFTEEKFDHFDHGSFFDGSHMSQFWIPFLQLSPPNFSVIRGKGISTLEEFTKIFDQTTLIDDACYGAEPNWSDYAIPDGLAEKWIGANPDIYSFLIKQDGTEEVIGYINAMPLKKETFEKLLKGKVHDHEIQPDDILPYDSSSKNLDIYVMSIALKPEFQNKHLDLKEYGFEKLYKSLIDKTINYYLNTGNKVNRIAAIGWTDKGKKLCKFMGMRQTGVFEEQTEKPIYLLTIKEPKDNRTINKSIRRLLDIYKK